MDVLVFNTHSDYTITCTNCVGSMGHSYRGKTAVKGRLQSRCEVLAVGKIDGNVLTKWERDGSTERAGKRN